MPKGVYTRTKENEANRLKAIKGNQYALGHKHDKKTRARISKGLTDNQNALGYRHTEEAKKKISKASTGRKASEETKAKISLATLGNEGFSGRKHSEETKEKMSKAAIGNQRTLGLKHTAESRTKMSKAQMGNTNTLGVWSGRKHSKETILKISGSNSSNWKGGIACEPYCDAWLDKEFKENIKERDGHKCQNPYCWDESKGLAIHHIDYNKKNCHPGNLITLCRSCNSRANAKREYWEGLYSLSLQELFKNAIEF